MYGFSRQWSGRYSPTKHLNVRPKPNGHRKCVKSGKLQMRRPLQPNLYLVTFRKRLGRFNPTARVSEMPKIRCVVGKLWQFFSSLIYREDDKERARSSKFAH